MTLIVAVPAQDGLVFASDMQVTLGAVRGTGRKILQLNQHVLWGGSGEVGVIQRLGELLESSSHRDQPLSSIRSILSAFVKSTITEALQNDFRAQFFQNSPAELLELHPVDFLFAEHREGRSRVLHVLSHGTYEWVENRIAATGNGAGFAHALLNKYSGVSLTCSQAKVLAYKVIDEAIQVGSYGLSHPIDIWEIAAAGARQATQEEMAGLVDTATVLRVAEINLLIGGSSTPGDAQSFEQTSEQELPA